MPATRPERFAKAAASGADAIIVDLEDAVAPADKNSARIVLPPAPAGLTCPVLLRINACGTAWHEADLAAAQGLPLAGIVLPKTECSGDLAHVAHRLGEGFPVLALVETAVGVDSLPMITRYPNVTQIAVIRRSFRPGEAELAWATRVLAAHDAAAGKITALNGEMIDAPIVARAHRLIAAAR